MAPGQGTGRARRSSRGQRSRSAGPEPHWENESAPRASRRCGVAPVTRRSGKSLLVTQRQAAHDRLRDAGLPLGSDRRPTRSGQPREVPVATRPRPRTRARPTFSGRPRRLHGASRTKHRSTATEHVPDAGREELENARLEAPQANHQGLELRLRWSARSSRRRSARRPEGAASAREQSTGRRPAGGSDAHRNRRARSPRRRARGSRLHARTRAADRTQERSRPRTDSASRSCPQ